MEILQVSKTRHNTTPICKEIVSARHFYVIKHIDRPSAYEEIAVILRAIINGETKKHNKLINEKQYEESIYRSIVRIGTAHCM